MAYVVKKFPSRTDEDVAIPICFLRSGVECPVQEDSQGAREEVSLPTTPAVTARLAALKHCRQKQDTR